MHGYARCFSSTEELTTLATLTRTIAGTETTVMIPLMFWFNRNAGLALPLVALQYHEVKLHIEFADQVLKSVFVSAVPGARPRSSIPEGRSTLRITPAASTCRGTIECLQDPNRGQRINLGLDRSYNSGKSYSAN